ncbi:flagellar hook capping FlgD N-terminal domain-containing protein [Alienimonas californiensis]|uniref:Basal-body rod modification protein FlgD n=1 Tax=Alienimonas californiensis TaxID=2527989 RepID=A0A517PE30_9PLAN|nr:flagellar hook capping FlgD N-terminal domain-containing protein [Alienimonas californiensis]QDT17635.1 Basal-body rod modification protein FlgD [Alienimonas californiensis]
MNDFSFPLLSKSAAPPAGPSENASGLSGLNADDFMTLMIAQLQNQDPSEPVSNETLLDQIATMRSLQADVELEQTLKKNAGAADLSTAASFLGKEIRGFNGGKEVAGTVTRAYLADGDAFVDVGGVQLSLGSITEVA